MDENNGISGTDNINGRFSDATEGEQNWAIRYGAEPVDLHMTGLSNDRGETREPGFWNITAGPAGFTNHNYIDIGRINDAGEFETLKRIQALAIDKNLTMLDPGNSRLFGFVIDGQYNTFEEDDMVLADDPHHERARDFQHADVEDYDLADIFTGDDPTDDYTHIVFQGSERDVMQIYAGMVAATIEINNQDPEFSAAADLSWNWMVGEAPNSNTFNAEMKEVANKIAEHLGVEIGEHDPSGWDIGATPDMLETTEPTVATWDSIDDLRAYVDRLEQASSEQWRTIQEKGFDTDLETEIPTPPAGGGGAAP